MRHLWAPWRQEYLASRKGPGGCVFCAAVRSADDEPVLVVHRTAWTVVLLNLYPYTSGHLLLAPRRHLALPSAADLEERSDLMEQLARMERALEEEYHPDGFNVGMNLGRGSGAGVPDHFHLHLLPRWEGDTNFMTAASETRVLSESLGDTWLRLRRRLGEAAGEGRGD